MFNITFSALLALFNQQPVKLGNSFLNLLLQVREDPLSLFNGEALPFVDQYA
jgi:hypothetical protein